MEYSRFASRAGATRSAYSEPAIGEKVSAFMNGKIKYSDGPIDDIEVVPDFLPPPDELALQEETVKVTIALSRSSVEFFKEKADKHHMPYQKMIRKLLDSYVEHQKRPLTNRDRSRAAAT